MKARRFDYSKVIVPIVDIISEIPNSAENQVMGQFNLSYNCQKMGNSTVFVNLVFTSTNKYIED